MDRDMDIMEVWEVASSTKLGILDRVLEEGCIDMDLGARRSGLGWR